MATTRYELRPSGLPRRRQPHLLLDLGPGAWDRSRVRRRGFTLIELLVVLALTAILMGVLFVPLSRSLDLAARGNAQIQAQDNVRAAMRKVRDDLSKAMVVYDQAPINIWTYNAFGTQDNRPTLLAGSTPVAFQSSSAMIAFRLPRQKYYCLANDHYVTPADFDLIYGAGAGTDDGVILTDTCPRHPGSRIELRASQPQQPSGRIVAYFVGLKYPGLVDGGGLPVYDNLLLFKRSFLAAPPAGWPASALNTYTLYRAEFDPANPAYQTFPTLTGGDANFFYDNTSITFNARTMPRWQWWLEIANPLIDIETGDVVRFVKNRGNNWAPQSLCNFNPAPITGEIAQPNQDVVTTGVFRFADASPIQYEADYGNWLSLPNEERFPVPDAAAIGPTSAIPGPRIEIVTTGGVVFDSSVALAAGGPRARLVAFDPISGRVILGHRRGAETKQFLWEPTGAANGGVVPDPSMPGDYNVDFSEDLLGGPSGMPSSYGGALSHYAGLYGAGTVPVRLVPGSETVELLGVGGVTKMRRLNNTRVPLEARADLEEDQYLINYDTGVLQLPRIVGVDWSVTGMGQPTSAILRISYSFQTNDRSDIVRVSYSTKELLAATLGTVQYTRRRAEALPFEVTERIALRNLRK